jgi:hypothetical protein
VPSTNPFHKERSICPEIPHDVFVTPLSRVYQIESYSGVIVRLKRRAVSADPEPLIGEFMVIIGEIIPMISALHH